MYSQVQSFEKKHRSLFVSFKVSFVCIILLLSGFSTFAQGVEVHVEEVMARHQPSSKKGKLEYFDILRTNEQQHFTSIYKTAVVFPPLTSNKLLPELMVPVTINYSIAYQPSNSTISVWVDGAHTLYTVVVKDSSGNTVYSGSGNTGTYEAPNIGSGTHTVYLNTDSGTVSENIYVN